MTAAIICLLGFVRTLWCGFINYDDPLYVLDNPLIRQIDGQGLLRMFSEAHAGYWMPLTWLSLAVDYRLWGLDPFGYHLTNIVLHAANTGLVVLIADNVLKEVRSSVNAQPGTQTAGQGWLHPATLLLAGLLWGIHPLRVESVAWVTERKDVLNGLFVLSSILCYLRYVRRRVEGNGLLPVYLLSLVLFACSLMSKSVSVVLPVMLLLLDLYPLNRLQRGTLPGILMEKVPFLLLSAGTAVITVVTMSGNLYSHDTFPLSQRILVSGYAVFEYCRLLLFPVGILPQYPLPRVLPVSFTVATIIVATAAVACCFAARGRKWVLTVLFCFLLPLIPTLPLVVPAGDQVMAARFSYLPSIAVSIAAAVAIATVFRSLKFPWQRRALLLGVAALMVFYAGMTQKLIGVWKDTETYWSRFIEIKPLGRAYSDRGRHYLETGRHAEAVEDLGRAAAIAMDVGMPEAFNLFAFRGAALAALGRNDEAVQDFSTAISLYPARTYFYCRGVSLAALGRLQEADSDFAQAGEDPGPLKWIPAP